MTLSAREISILAVIAQATDDVIKKINIDDLKIGNEACKIAKDLIEGTSSPAADAYRNWAQTLKKIRENI